MLLSYASTHQSLLTPPTCHFCQMNVVHFLSNGGAKLIFRYQKERFCMSPILIIRALLDITDRDIYRRLTEPGDSDYYLRWRMGALRGGGGLHRAAQ